METKDKGQSTVIIADEGKYLFNPEVGVFATEITLPSHGTSLPAGWSEVDESYKEQWEAEHQPEEEEPITEGEKAI